MRLQFLRGVSGCTGGVSCTVEMQGCGPTGAGDEIFIPPGFRFGILLLFFKLGVDVARLVSGMKPSSMEKSRFEICFKRSLVPQKVEGLPRSSVDACIE